LPRGEFTRRDISRTKSAVPIDTKVLLDTFVQ
jgi:hypothetical protein